MERKQLWIGLIDAVQETDSKLLGDANGGYANVIAKATGRAEFLQRVQTAIAKMGLKLVEVDDVEPLAKRARNMILSSELEEMAATAERLDTVVIGTFFVYQD